ncbi:MAG: imidazole glycerol phosphate synthase subunit HisH [Bacteroidia bacterium]|nr:imidazole glycerol phosphate synthase subunit HisH [Bacteroidia bacterium]
MIAIIDYNAGNTRSVLFAMNRLNVDAVLTSDHSKIQSADKVIFPGVGEASTTMAFLQNQGLDQLITSLRQPVLGICLGLQLMCKHSEENDTKCLGIFDVEVKRFSGEGDLKVPQMGWNQIMHLSSPLFAKNHDGDYAYFVHSYYAELADEYTIAQTTHGETFSSALHRDNFFATQFHPEKSGNVGENILKSFLEL